MKKIEELKPEDKQRYVLVNMKKGITNPQHKIAKVEYDENIGSFSFNYPLVYDKNGKTDTWIADVNLNWLKSRFTHFEEWTPKEEKKPSLRDEIESGDTITGFDGTDETVTKIDGDRYYHTSEGWLYGCEITHINGAITQVGINKDLKNRVEELEKIVPVKLKEVIKNIGDCDVIHYEVDDLINLGDIIEKAAKATRYYIDKKQELSVEGIYKKHKGFWSQEYTKKTKAFKKLLIIADYVNDGWVWKWDELYNYPIFDAKNLLSYTSNLQPNVSPIKINPSKWDYFISIKGIEQLIKEYLA